MWTGQLQASLGRLDWAPTRHAPPVAAVCLPQPSGGIIGTAVTIVAALGLVVGLRMPWWSVNLAGDMVAAAAGVVPGVFLVVPVIGGALLTASGRWRPPR